MDTNDLKEGLDPSGLLKISGSQLLQMVREATPSDSRGFILFDESTPNVATHPRYARYTWYKPSEIASPIPRRWNGTGWVVTTAGPGSIGTTQLADNAVTLAKLYNPSGSVNYLLRVNGAGNGWELWPFSLANGSVTIAKLQATGLPDAYKVLQINAAGTAFELANVSARNIANGTLPYNKLVAGGAETFLKFTSGAWTDTVIDPITDFTNGGIPLNKLAVGTNGQFMRFTAGNWTSGAIVPSTDLSAGSVPVTKLTPGSPSQYLITDAGGAVTWTPIPTSTQPPYAQLSGSGANAAYPYYIPLSSEISDVSNIITALAANNFALAAGTYRFRLKSVAQLITGTPSKIIVRNVTDGADILSVGGGVQFPTVISLTGTGNTYSSEICGMFTLAVGKTVGFYYDFGGTPELINNSTTNEVEIWKIS